VAGSLDLLIWLATYCLLICLWNLRNNIVLAGVICCRKLCLGGAHKICARYEKAHTNHILYYEFEYPSIFIIHNSYAYPYKKRCCPKTITCIQSYMREHDTLRAPMKFVILKHMLISFKTVCLIDILCNKLYKK